MAVKKCVKPKKCHKFEIIVNIYGLAVVLISTNSLCYGDVGIRYTVWFIQYSLIEQSFTNKCI